MNIREAIDTQTLLRYFLRISPHGATIPNRDEARKAAEYLAGRASVTLSAGLRPDDVNAAWGQAKHLGINTKDKMK